MVNFCTNCGKKETARHKLYMNEHKICAECVSKNTDNEIEISDSLDEERPITNSSLRKILHEVINPQIRELKEEIKSNQTKNEKEFLEVKEDIKKVKNENAGLKARVKELEERNEKVMKVVKEQQVFIASIDKERRLKRLMISGIDENIALEVDDKIANTDKEKINMIFDFLNIECYPDKCFRMGSKDRGSDARPRLICAEFSKQNERNTAKKEFARLQNTGNDQLKKIKAKPDQTKQEKSEYARLYKVKETLTREHPDDADTIKISYGKLYMGEEVIDSVQTPTLDF